MVKPASKALRVLLTVGMGFAAGLAVLGTFSRTSGKVGPGRVVVRVSPSRHGYTAVELPPLGRVTARTPAAPMALTVRVDEIDMARLQQAITSRDPVAALSDKVRHDLPALVRRMVVRSVAAATIAGALLPLVLPGRRWWHAVVGALAAVISMVVLGVFGWAQFDVGAFRQPRFEGALERAPSIVEAAQQHVADLRGVEDRVKVLGNQLADLYAESAAVDVGGHVPGETQILHVSDVHSNPLGLELAVRLATSFHVDAVVDTGDITSFGYPVESEIGQLVAQVPVPYLFVPGNHDSDANRSALAKVPNVRLLDGDVATVGGVRILGIADPTFTATNQIDAAQAKRIKLGAAPAVAGQVQEKHPDVLAVHDTTLAADSLGRVPLVIAGHVHRRTQTTKKGTLVLTVGSTGAGGLGAFTVKTASAYEAEILRFQRGRLVAIDYVTLRGVSGDFSIQRELISGNRVAPPIAPSTVP